MRPRSADIDEPFRSSEIFSSNAIDFVKICAVAVTVSTHMYVAKLVHTVTSSARMPHTTERRFALPGQMFRLLNYRGKSECNPAFWCAITTFRDIQTSRDLVSDPLLLGTAECTCVSNRIQGVIL